MYITSTNIFLFHGGDYSYMAELLQQAKAVGLYKAF